MKKFLGILGIGIAIVAMQCPSALAGGIGMITYAEGRVDRAASGTQSYFPSVVGEEVSVGDLVRTKSYAKAEITFNDGSVVKLGGSSHIQIQAYEVDDKGSRTQGTIRLDRGKIRAIVQKADDRSPFDVLTPNASGSVKGSDLFVSYLKSATNVLVTEGVFKTVNPAFPDRVVEVGAGKSSSIPFNNPPLEPRPYSKAEKKRLESSTGSVLPVSAGDFQNRRQIHAIIAKVSGAVRVQSKDAKEWHAATLNEELFSGDRIETGENGRIEISLDNGHVIELRARTQLMIKRLSRDPATGTYENYMESEFGRIRAKLQKITPNSNFQIKTPTSVCSVRGTIMYLIISSQLTQAFFEGGDGYVMNTLSQVTKTIYAGMSTASDNQGNMTDPTETTGGERNEFDSDWGGDQSGDTEYGYSNSDQGSTGGDDSGDQGSGGTGNNNTDAGGNNNSGNDVFDLVPPTPNNGGSNPPEINPKASSLGLEGSFGTYDSLLDGEGEGGAGSISAVIQTERADTAWSGLGQATLQGTFSRTEGESLWGGDLSGSGNDGGTMQGFSAGTWHSWDTLVADLFIDPAGTAGVVLGYLSGTGNAASGVFSGSGALIFAPIEATEILPKDLFTSTVKDPVLYGGLGAAFSEAAGFLESEYKLERMHLDEAAWGIWRAFYRGSYSNPDEVRQWEGLSGGGIGSENGYAFGEIYGTDNLNGHLSINETSTHLNLYDLSYYSGDITGTYSDSFYGSSFFEGAGVGYYQTEPLTLNGTVGAGFDGEWLPGAGGLYYFVEGGLYGYDGRNEGYLGGTSSPWSGSEPFIGIGMAEMPYSESNFLWNTNFVSGKGLPDEWTTPDDAAVFGLLTGVWKDQMIIGSSVALYRDHEGYLGYLGAGFSGLYEPGSEAWMIIGAFSPERMVQMPEVSAEQFFNAISYEPQISCQLYGSFDGFGSITGGAEGYPYLLDTDLVETPFGIFNFTFGMDSSNSYEDKPLEPSSWTAVLGGWDNAPDTNYFFGRISGGGWDSGYVLGDFEGKHLTDENLLSFRGQLYGIDDGDLVSGDWGGAAIGTIEVLPLQLTGLWGGIENSLYWDDAGNMSVTGEEFGLIGAATAPWNGPSDMIAIGEYAMSPKVGPLLWNTPVESYNGKEGTATTLDGGAFFGDTVGIWNNSAMSGVFYALYMDPDHTVGYLRGELTGEYCDPIGMWMTEGLLTATPVESMPELDPEEFNSGIATDIFEDLNFIGDFSGHEGSIQTEGPVGRYISPTDESTWGLYQIVFGSGNSYDKPADATEWSGKIWESFQGDGYDYYQFLRIDGTWVDNEIRGAIHGHELTDEYVSRVDGDFFGIATDIGDGLGTWIGVAVGSAREEVNNFNGLWGGGDGIDGALYQNQSGTMEQVDVSYGLIGAAISPWENSQEYIAMGKYTRESESQTYLWNTTFESPRGTSTTRDGGAYWGYSAGIWKDEVMKGSAVTFFVDASGNAGLLTGPVDGEFDPRIDMWMAGGVLTPDILATGLELSPEYLESSVMLEPLMTFDLAGNFGGEGSVTGGGSGYIRYLAYGEETELPFGIYNFSFGDGNDYLAKPENTDVWSADFGGTDEGYDTNYFIGHITDGRWENNEMSAKMNGHQLTDESLMTFEGDLFGIEDGVYDEELKTYSGDWVATSLGTVMHEDLTFTGISGSESQSLAAKQDGEWDSVGTDWGVIGGTSSPWSNASNVLAMGAYDIPSEVNTPYLWQTLIQSRNGPDENNLSLDGGAFLGWMLGVWNDGAIDGFYHALYIDPEGNVGYLNGDIAGKYFPGIGMWELDGVLEANLRNEEMGWDAENAFENNCHDYQVMEGYYGGFKDGGSMQGFIFQESLDLLPPEGDLDWGIWGSRIFGSYDRTGVTSFEWQLPFSGRDGENIDPLQRGPYLMGSMKGTEWADGRLSGDIAAVWVDAPRNEFIDELERQGIYIAVGHASGEVTGSYDVEGEDWQAVAAGEWVEDSELIDMTDLAEMTQKLVDAGNVMSIPVSVVNTITDLASSSGQFLTPGGGAMSAVLDMNMYAATPTLPTEGIWAAVIQDGMFSGPTSADWALEFVNGDDRIQFGGVSWDNNQWAANVTGSVAGNTIVGSATGAYQQPTEGSGTFSGAATGQWQSPAPETPPV